MKANRLLGVALPLLVIAATLTESGLAQEVPPWVKNDIDTDHIVAKSERFPTRVEVVENRLATVRNALSEWANENCGSDCVHIINAIPDAELDALIDQDFIEPIRKYYDDSESSELSGQWDDFYKGHFRVCISDGLQQTIKQEVAHFQLRHRLAVTLLASVFSLGAGVILWSYLFVTRLTRGFYVSRLRWIAGTLAVGLVAICYWLWRITP